ncbi:GL14110 [Drosophila persimilis]|uniref:GL14110 n=1 Tax=Drosophila persimilis TaxID=7234 RepID=B4H8A6_DROPE|nr:thioredoxin-1 [Drosophila persimilis]EDW34921.1 GL14110 [Drosophila persimilis]
MACIRSMNDFHKKMDAAEGKVVVLDLYATWYGPCKDMDKSVKSMARKYSTKAMVIKSNVDKFLDLVDQYKIKSMPTFIFLRGTTRLARFRGADEHNLIKTIKKLTK